MAKNDDNFNTLARHPLLAALEPDALRLVAQAAEQRSLRRGEVLFCRDEPSDGGYCLRSGLIVIGTGVAEKDKALKPPALLGEMALVAPTRRPGTAIAREPSGVLYIARTLFHKALSQSPKSAERVRRLLERRLLGFAHELDFLREKSFEEL